jgi:nucleotide-binding universal stress UspA family protein
MVPMLDDVTEIAEEQASATARLVAPLRDEFPTLTVTVDVVRAPSVAGALVDVSAHADLLVLGARRPNTRSARPWAMSPTPCCTTRTAPWRWSRTTNPTAPMVPHP